MNKPIVKNWMKYWASTLAVSGMLVMGSCSDSDRSTADNTTTAPERENVSNTTVAEDDVDADDVAATDVAATDVDGTRMDQPSDNAASTTTTTTVSDAPAASNAAQTPAEQTQSTQSSSNATASSSSQWRSSSASADKLIKKHPEVNQAIDSTLSAMTREEVNASLAQQESQSNQDMAAGEQSGVAYDNMSNTDAADMDSDQSQSNDMADNQQAVASETDTDASASDIDTDADTDADTDTDTDTDAAAATAQDGAESEIQTSDYQTTNWGNTSTTEPDERADDTEVENAEYTSERNNLVNTDDADAATQNMSNNLNSTAEEAESEVEATANEVETEVETAANEVEAEVETAAAETETEIESAANEVESEVETAANEVESEVETAANETENAVESAATEVESEVETTANAVESEVESTSDNMASDQQDVTYDNMSNTDAAAEGSEYSSVYDPYMDPSMEMTEQERQMIEEARRDYESRKVSMTVVEARPDVNMSELIEEIKEETRLPKELEDAKMEGTVLVQFEVDDQGAISNAEVIDGFISQTKEDGSLMSYIRLSDKTQSEIAEEMNKEDLMEFKGEDRDKIIEAVTQESLRVVESTSGKWQPAKADATEQADQATASEDQKAVMVMPIRFDIED